ncbi:MAG: hypothetical protein ACE5GW_05750 [Planctomycetota bacterium]
MKYRSFRAGRFATWRRGEGWAFRSLTLVVAMAGVFSLTISGCSGPQEASSPAAASPADENPVFHGAAAGSPIPADQEERANQLVGDTVIQSQERRAAALAGLEAGKKLMNELRYVEAEEKLQDVLRLDPENEEARKLLEEVLLILGDRGGELGGFARQEAERQKVRRQQDKVELERLYVEGRRQMESGEYERAVSTFDQVLERIKWFPFNVDLSDLQTRATSSKGEAERLARERQASEREQRERRVFEEAEAEHSRSLRLVENRIRELMRRAEKLYRERRFEATMELTNQILDLDRSHPGARRLHRRASNLRHLHEVMQISMRNQDEWGRTFMAQLESEIPYTKIFNFPPRDEWNALRRKQISLEERISGRESSQERNIKLALKNRYTVEFDDQPFEEVIDFVQSISGINFVLTKEARDAVEDSGEPVRLAPVKDLPLENILNLILRGREPAFSYVIKSGAVVIGPADTIRPDLLLEFYEVSDITKDHPDFKAPRLELDVQEGSGSGAGGSILDLDEEEDTTEVTIGGDVLVELTTKTLYGEEDAEPEGESIKYQNGKLVARTTLDNHHKIGQLLEALRKSTGIMVTVESRFIDLQDNFLQTIGVDFGNPFNSNLPNPIDDIDGSGTQISSGYEFVDAQQQTDVRAAVYNAFSLPLGSSVAPFQLSSQGGFALQYNVLDTYILEAILEANAKTQKFKKLDGTRVTAFNTQISHSLVIDQAAYIRDAEVNQTGVIPVINPVIGILNSGSILQVRPTVSHDRKYVILEIQPTQAVQLPSRFKRLILGLTSLDVEFPVLSVTNIRTTVTIPDGGTVLVGGLKRTITQKARSGIPAVSRLPFLNVLFGRKGDARMQSNLFVLITAKITVIRDEERKNFN